MKKIKLLHIKITLFSWLICFALVRLTQITTTNPVSLVYFILCILGLTAYYSQSKILLAQKKYWNSSLIISGIFAISTILSEFAQITSNLESFKFKLVIVALSFTGFWIMYFYLTIAFFIISESWVITSENLSSRKHYLPMLAFVLCIVCWLPSLFTNFPGILTIDSINQYGQAIGSLPLSNHHPYFHTLMIKACISIGNLLGGATLGIAIYSTLQMIISAFVIAFLVSTLILYNAKPVITYCIICFFSLLPYNGYMMVTMWKDIPFSMSLLLFSTCLLRICISEKSNITDSWFTYILYILSGIGVGLLRSNGFYIIIVITPIVLMIFNAKRHLLTLLSFIIIFFVLFVKYPLYKAYNVTEPDFVENLSIPLQTMGRVFIDDVATEDERNQWNQYLDVSAIPEYYYANVSDNMKSLAKSSNSDYLDSHKSEFLKLWITTGFRHPVQYISAWGDITKGYWYPDTIPENPIAGDEGIIPNDYGLTATPILKGGFFVKIKELLFKLPNIIPIYGLLFSIGAYVWFMILMAGKIISCNNKSFIICILPSFLYLVTVFLAIPVACEFRYGYEFIVCSPIYFCAAFIKPSEKV